VCPPIQDESVAIQPPCVGSTVLSDCRFSRGPKGPLRTDQPGKKKNISVTVQGRIHQPEIEWTAVFLPFAQGQAPIRFCACSTCSNHGPQQASRPGLIRTGRPGWGLPLPARRKFPARIPFSQEPAGEQGKLRRSLIARTRDFCRDWGRKRTRNQNQRGF